MVGCLGEDEEEEDRVGGDDCAPLYTALTRELVSILVEGYTDERIIVRHRAI